MPVGRRVGSTKVFLGLTVEENRGRKSKGVAEDLLGVWALHAMKGIIAHAEVFPRDKILDLVEVEALLQEIHVIFSAVEHLHLEMLLPIGRVVLGLSDLADINLRQVIRHSQLGDRLSLVKDGVCDLLRSRSTIHSVELDPEVFVDATRVVRGRKDESSDGLESAFTVAEDSRGRGGGEETILPDPQSLHSSSHSDLRDDLNGLTVEVASVSRDDQSSFLDGNLLVDKGVEHTLHEVGKVVLLHKLTSLLAQS
mmetsp:Transcript_9791/g.22317  ORF Transcript_9791/g.22317 Transcript_9791/m.22317 type:complete len:253 (+) Transcript_9791:537-1295(+)